jgi:hypothetical protein
MFSTFRGGKVVGSGLVLAAAIVMGGCMSNTDNTTGSGTTHADTAAANLLTTLDSLLREHVELTATMTDAALGGRTDEYNAAAGAVDANSVELSKAISTVYSDDQGTAFLALWRKYIGYIVDYTTAVAKSDKDGQAAAERNLVQYTQDFGAFFQTATNGGVKQAPLADLAKQQVVNIMGVVDAQATKDYASAYTKERDAARFMDTIGKALADAVSLQFPDKF